MTRDQIIVTALTLYATDSTTSVANGTRAFDLADSWDDIEERVLGNGDIVIICHRHQWASVPGRNPSPCEACQDTRGRARYEEYATTRY